MSRSPYSIFKRKDREGREFFSVRFFGPDGSVIKTKALREARSLTHAARIAEAILKDGVIANESNPDTISYLLSFWSRDSEYVQGRALRGLVLSERYLSENRMVTKSMLEPLLKGVKLLDLSPMRLEKIILSLNKKGYGARRINIALQALKVPYANFCKLHRLVNQLSTIEKVKERPRERGVLTGEEVGRIINLEAAAPRVRASVLLGALCGLRLGEVRGLLWEDVDFQKKPLFIRHNFVNKEEGVKAPKWGSVREVPLPEPVAAALEVVQSLAPEGAAFIVYNERTPSRPVTESTIRAGFKSILHAIGISEAEKERRNLCFHGLRHTFVTLSRAGGVPDFLVQRMAGHKSMNMTERYSHADGVVDFTQARAALEGAVNKVAGGSI